MKNLILILNILFIIQSCQNNTTKSASEEKKAENIVVAASPKWALIKEGSMDDNPTTQVYVVTKDSILIEKASGAINEISKEEYTDKQIPTEALSACSGFWAGLESRYYIADSADSWVVKAMYIDEGSDGKEKFETVKTIKKN